MSEETSIGPLSQIVDGFRIPGALSAENFRSAVNYKPRPDDLFLITFPKCGTTWTGNILTLILDKGQPLKSSSEMHAKSPFLEMAGAKSAEEMVRPGTIKTHLPFDKAPWSEKAKYIYVARNPKDCCVSYFYHMRNVPLHEFYGTFDQFFEMFISGTTDFGDYFDHLLSWYACRNEPNILFVTYEELQEDFDSTILKMASFIDDEKYAEPIRKEPQVMENIKKYSSLKEMKEFMNKGFDDMFKMSEEELQNSSLPDSMKEFIIKARNNPKTAELSKKGDSNMSQFVRKGIIGDWRNHFSEDQSRRMDEKFAEKTKGTNIPDYWKKYM